MTQDLEHLLLVIDATTEQLRREMKSADQSVKQTADNIDKHTGRIATAFDKANGAAHGHGVMLKAVETASVRLEERFAELSREAGAFGAIISKMGPVGLAAAAGIGAIALAVTESVAAFKTYEVEQARMQAVFRATGGAVGLTLEQLNELSDKLENGSLFDLSSIQHAEAEMLTFKSITGETFERAIADSANLAALLGEDIPSAALKLGRALEDPVGGMTALRRAGIIFSPVQKQIIENFVATGQHAQAASAVLDAVEGKVNGVAAAMKNTLAGALDSTSKGFEHLAVSIGDVIAEKTHLKLFFTILGVGLTELSGKIDDATDRLNRLSNQQITRKLADTQTEIAAAQKKIASMAAAMHQPGFTGEGWGIGDDLAKLKAKEKEYLALLAERKKAEEDAAAVSKQAAPVDTSAYDKFRQKILDETATIKGLTREQYIEIHLREESKKLTADQLNSIRALLGAEYDATKAKEASTKAQTAQNKAMESAKSLFDKLSAKRDDLQSQLDNFGGSNLADQQEKLHKLVERNADAFALLGEKGKRALADIDAETKQLIEDNKSKFLEKTSQDYEQQIQLAQLSGRDQAMLKARFDALNTAKEKGFKIDEDQLQNLQQLAARAYDATNAAKALDDAMKHAFENIQDALAKMLEDGKFSFKSLVDVAKKAAAEIAAALIIRPVIGNIAGSLGINVPGVSGGSGGLLGNLGTSVAGNAITNAAGASSWLSDFNAAGQAALPSLFATGASAATGAGLTGAFEAGIGGAASVGGATVAGEFAAGVGGGAAAGSAGTGALAALGLNPATAALAVAAIAIPMIIKQFSGTPHPASTFGGTLSDTGAFGDLALKSKHTDTALAQGIEQALTQMTTALKQAGITGFAGHAITGGFDVSKPNGGGFLTEDGKTVASFDPKNADAVSKALLDLTLSMVDTTHADESLRNALDYVKASGEDATAVMTDLGKAISIPQDVTAGILDIIDPVASKVMQENARYFAQLADAQRLGLGQVVISQIGTLHSLVLHQLTDTNGATQAVADSLKSAADNAKSLADRFSNISGSFQGIIQSLTIGASSALDPVERLAAMRAQVTNLGAQARLGDPQAAEDLAKLLPDFVQLSGEVNGFNRQYGADQAMALQLAQATKDTADRQTQIQTAAYNTATSQLAEAQKQTGLLAQILNIQNPINATRDFGKQPDVNREIAASVPRFTDNFGNGQLTNFILNSATSDEKARIRAILIAHNIVPQFAQGGIVTGGIPGVDSVPAMVMPGEAVIRARAVSAASASQRQALAQGNLPVANDNREVSARIDRLIAVTETLVKVTAASGNMHSEQLSGVQEELAGLRKATRLRAR